MVVKTVFGSYLYGTSTPDSDTDYRGVVLPTKEQLLLGRLPKSIRGEGEDEEYYNLHYFIKLACDGQTVAFDMLFAPSTMVVSTSFLWKKIQDNRDKFLSKNIKAFIGYARSQASKYSIKGERLTTAKKVLSYMEMCDLNDRMSKIWHLLGGEHIHSVEDTPNGIKQKQVCGKILQETMNVHYAQGILNKFVDEYGKRARSAASSSGKDWKAISHAVRVLLEVEELLENRTITFPLKEKDFVKRIKLGEINMKEVVQFIDTKEARVQKLCDGSDLPERVNRKFWDKFIIKTMKEYVL